MGRLSKAKWCLLGCLIVVLLFLASSIFVPSSLSNAVKWLASSDFAYKLKGPSEREIARKDTLVEMVVERIGVSKLDYQPVVILREKGGERRLPIWVGVLEANAISVVLEGVQVRRPLTPDLLCSILDRAGASVNRIIINDLKEDIFYANIIIKSGWTMIEIDARPSDAIAIALRVRAPIYVEKAVLDKAGIQPEQERDKRTIMHLEGVEAP